MRGARSGARLHRRGSAALSSHSVVLQRIDSGGGWTDVVGSVAILPGEAVRLFIRNIGFPFSSSDVTITAPDGSRSENRIGTNWVGHAWLDFQAGLLEGRYEVVVTQPGFLRSHDRTLAFTVRADAPTPPEVPDNTTGVGDIFDRFGGGLGDLGSIAKIGAVAIIGLVILEGIKTVKR